MVKTNPISKITEQPFPLELTSLADGDISYLSLISSTTFFASANPQFFLSLYHFVAPINP